MRRTSSKALRSSVADKGSHGFNQVGRILLASAHSQTLSALPRKSPRPVIPRRSPWRTTRNLLVGRKNRRSRFLAALGMTGRGTFIPVAGPKAHVALPREEKSPGRTLAAKTGKGVLIACLVALPLVPAFAWVYPEHRNISLLAVERLDPEQRELLQKLWLEARSVNQGHLCQNVVEPAQGLNPTCLDYAAWAAIAGDHSCSARDMLGIVLNAPWILNVARVSARLKVQLAASKRRDQRANAVRGSDIALQRADPEYGTRASSNKAHFLLARPDVAMEPLAYARLALGPNADLNALATYLWYHLRALSTANRVSRGGISPETRAQVVRAALADEAFALHFLEDSFAAGHVAGNWGNAAVRKGTHDYYNEHGVALVTWSGHRFVAVGDAYMRPEDAERAATAVRDSLAQMLEAFNGKAIVSLPDGPAPTEPAAFNVCQGQRISGTEGSDDDIRKVVPTLAQTPVPALGKGLGELPRFRAELGPFVGLSTAFLVQALGRGFGTTQNNASANAGLEAAVRAGIGLEGVLNESSDGLAFAEVGIREDTHATSAATLPARAALTVRMRAPFWLVPGDLLVAGPVLAFTSRRTLQKMAVQAANGGLIPWQSGIATRIGRFQFVLGREVGLSFYHNSSGHPLLIPTPGVPPTNATLVALSSLQVDFPILEWRLFRTFSLTQSSGLMIQPYVGFDTPTKTSVVSPVGAPTPHLQTIVTGGIRLVFDWRHYVK